jgi:uncharacterized membrane protein
MAAVHPPSRDDGAFEERLAGAYVVGTDRTSTQDADFAVQQLVEVALRALLPGVNEPFTAITCIDRLGQGLARLASRRIPGAIRLRSSSRRCMGGWRGPPRDEPSRSGETRGPKEGSGRES